MAEPAAIPKLKKTEIREEARFTQAGCSLVAMFRKCICSGEFRRYITTPRIKSTSPPLTRLWVAMGRSSRHTVWIT